LVIYAWHCYKNVASFARPLLFTDSLGELAGLSEHVHRQSPAGTFFVRYATHVAAAEPRLFWAAQNTLAERNACGLSGSAKKKDLNPTAHCNLELNEFLNNG